MGFLDRLFSKASASRLAASNAGKTGSVGATLWPGDETLEVVGESYRQDALWAIVGGRRSEPIRHETHALLIPEPDSPYDPNAIQVLIAGQLVGYLSREDAAAYRPGLLALMRKNVNGLVALDAVIVGGGLRPDGPGRLGVFLDHDPADFGIEEPEDADFATRADLPPGYGFRSGLSSARSTDLEDDSYDLSWLDDLSGNVATAIRQLRTLLGTVANPIDRHYMMAELEERLYRCRDAFSSALDEYDEVCRQHDAEMDVIRSALFEKFGRLPILDTYRQAVVRFQRARDWPTVRRWAERGLGVYGEDAAKPEAVEDLRKRVAHATAKIEAASRPKPPRRSRAVVTTTTEVETLVCTECGATFERVRTRGRKPHACPSCRGTPGPAN
jgi:rubrerythrin